MIESFLQESGIPGAVIAFGLPGTEPELRAYGMADPISGVPMRPDDRFKIASLSKPITSEAILELIARRGLSVDTPVADLLPWARQARDSRVAAITLRDLLEHSGGWDPAETFAPFFVPRRDLVARLGVDPDHLSDCAPIAQAMLQLPLQYDPGQRYAYSNLDYCLLGLVVSRLYGGSYEDAVHALLPETAGMSLDPSTLTVRHTVRPEEEGFLAERPEIVAAAAGWISGARDYFRFASRAVAPLSYERPPYASGPEFYGLGWMVWELGDETVLTHFGAMPGVFSVVVKRPGGPIFVALFNGRPPNAEGAYRTLVEGVLTLGPG
ncbi:Beta-lactamase class C and other penicillin binding protein [Rubellimicrobium mesophilum DSM 19309]|uniref:Beta-lactamase class C and other penicillin binding protein n=1 Tax=Rubellimicrobium mesophilum DSM 19309 TaxID=442562 RepID=A0A017HMX5_9RHOB|nr:serine hydrolase domain-containing protein [Rubellimicrobium mesophilum]EYD75842.1 Beta-lactamase class C and other penicillin binding protein [Rubellimicrobium mesophilum DSM 19309]